MRRAVTSALLAVLLLLPAVARAEFRGAYAYPFVDPLAATVAQTPQANQAKLPSEARINQIAEIRYVRPFPNRKLPEIFWYNREGMPYWFLKQPFPDAPLAFNIGGTGAGADAQTSRLLARALYSVGFHVVSIPSPTHPSFITTASETMIPGRMQNDAADIYRVMRMIDADLKGEIKPTGYYVLGFSLGGTHTGFVAELDSRLHAFDFKRALMINPSVDLINSLHILDNMLDKYVRQDPHAVRNFLDGIFSQIVANSNPNDQINLTDDNLVYRAYTTLEPSERELEMVIGFVFRLSSNDIAFTSDVMTNAGYIVPKNAVIRIPTTLTDVFVKGFGLNFEDYFDGVYVPYYAKRYPGLTREDMIKQASLRAIEGFLRKDQRVRVISNEDDIILSRGEPQWLNQVFGARAQIFPTGGHGGNLAQRDVVHTMLQLLIQ